jgi:hypothetical protein
MSVFVAEVDAAGRIVSDHSENSPILRFTGAQEECECVAVALNELARQQHAKLMAAENEKRLDNLARWDRERVNESRPWRRRYVVWLTVIADAGADWCRHSAADQS